MTPSARLILTTEEKLDQHRKYYELTFINLGTVFLHQKHLMIFIQVAIATRVLSGMKLFDNCGRASCQEHTFKVSSTLQPICLIADKEKSRGQTLVITKFTMSSGEQKADRYQYKFVSFEII